MFNKEKYWQDFWEACGKAFAISVTSFLIDYGAPELKKYLIKEITSSKLS
jgi:hypothetical protein